MVSMNAKGILLAFILLVVAAFAEADQKLVGTWTQEGPVVAIWTFRPDGSGFMEQQDPRTTARFTWNCHGTQLQVSTGSLSVPYTVVKNDGSSLVIRNDQSSATYTLRKDP